jgi:hypothetical protein
MKVILILAIVFSITAFAHVLVPTPRAFASKPTQKTGLEITVIGDKAVFASNEPLKFVVRFRNVSNKPLWLYNADHFWNWKLLFIDAKSQLPFGLQTKQTDQLRAQPTVRELKPGDSWEVTADWTSTSYPYEFASELILNMPIPPNDYLSKGQYHFYVAIPLKANPDAKPAELYWAGEINAGPSEIEISDKVDPRGAQAGEPVKENGAEFQTVALTEWPVPPVGEKSEIRLGLKVTNRSGRWMQINVFDAVQVVLKDSDGKAWRGVRERDATSVPEPLFLQPREGQTIYRNATLERGADGNHLRLIGSDGAGGNWHFDGLHPGTYEVGFVYESDDQTLQKVLARQTKRALNPQEAPFWIGKATTQEMKVEVVDPRTQRQEHTQ